MILYILSTYIQYIQYIYNDNYYTFRAGVSHTCFHSAALLIIISIRVSFLHRISANCIVFIIGNLKWNLIVTR